MAVSHFAPAEFTSRPLPVPPHHRYLVIDLGFAIEPREEDLLPEALFATVRLSRMDISSTKIIEAEGGDMILGGGGVH
jgi:hypothetical protein